eukprot:gnl/TRDRNA2_/TRDRNA2_141238_c1_seq1.p2 gnl/TRDRNA2_/TRDRNA2_141238_c1~~gnl/TRDRNA2_/TRDRNA2_141238_c1_seq1.p2  ORF type:complete len:109 (+),score=9.09 gnl/TRDRNA2_/TRDRNA2_141238_c1_seq1:90-416(+)
MYHTLRGKPVNRKGLGLCALLSYGRLVNFSRHLLDLRWKHRSFRTTHTDDRLDDIVEGLRKICLGQISIEPSFKKISDCALLITGEPRPQVVKNPSFNLSASQLATSV